MSYRRESIEGVPEEIATLEGAVRTLTEEVTSHPVYQELDTLRWIRTFMESHAFAVWNFMSLLKALQLQLSCVSLPWLPRGDPVLRRLVNEIVLEEESDVTERGVMSHFELYRSAMTEAGADTAAIDAFLAHIRRRVPPAAALSLAGAPSGTRPFVLGDWRIIEAGDVVEIATTFAFGRELVIPEMFTSVRSVAEHHPDELSLLLDYLNRHIELDGEVHRPMALRMVAAVCGNDGEKWRRAERVAADALRRRLKLWDSVRSQWSESRDSAVELEV